MLGKCPLREFFLGVEKLKFPWSWEGYPGLWSCIQVSCSFLQPQCRCQQSRGFLRLIDVLQVRPPHAVCCSCFNLPPALCQLDVWSVGAEDTVLSDLHGWANWTNFFSSWENSDFFGVKSVVSSSTLKMTKSKKKLHLYTHTHTRIRKYVMVGADFPNRGQCKDD